MVGRRQRHAKPAARSLPVGQRTRKGLLTMIEVDRGDFPAKTGKCNGAVESQRRLAGSALFVRENDDVPFGPRPRGYIADHDSGVLPVNRSLKASRRQAPQGVVIHAKTIPPDGGKILRIG